MLTKRQKKVVVLCSNIMKTAVLFTPLCHASTWRQANSFGYKVKFLLICFCKLTKKAFTFPKVVSDSFQARQKKL